MAIHELPLQRIVLPNSYSFFGEGIVFKEYLLKT